MSTARVSERAGISRGAQQHHFRQKSELVADAVRHLAAERTAELSRRASLLPDGAERLEGVVDLLWESFTGDLFQAALELWVAARTDAELRTILLPVEADVARAITAMLRDMLGETWAAQDGAEDRIQLALNTIRGHALLRMLQHDAAAVERQWRFAREALVALLSEPARAG
jgi:AcrR family transcriptional regulator